MKINRRDALQLAGVTVVGGAALVVAVKGDVRADSVDSRTYGQVPLREVIGTVEARRDRNG
jgi:hypothetical protein